MVVRVPAAAAEVVIARRRVGGAVGHKQGRFQRRYRYYGATTKQQCHFDHGTQRVNRGSSGGGFDSGGRIDRRRRKRMMQ